MKNIIITLLFFVTITACKDERSELGDRYFKQGKYEEAIKSYTEYLHLEPTHIKSLYNRGRAYEELRQYDKALDDFRKVIKDDPNNINAYLSIASDYYHRQKDYENTIFYAEKILNLSENNAVAHTLKGKAYQKLGKLKEAMTAYDAAISVRRDYVDAYVSRGLLKVYLKQISRACSDFRMAKSLGATNAEGLMGKYCK